MLLTSTTAGGRLAISVNGRMDNNSAPAFDKEINEILSSNPGSSDLLLDCSDLVYVSSTGLRSLLSLEKRIESEGRKLTLKKVDPDIMEIFRMTGFTEFFVFED